jgi:acetyl esterase/lipase
MPDSFRLTENVVYREADGAELQLDYGIDEETVPAGESGARPIVVWIHGGAWLTGERSGEGQRILMRRVAAAGFLACSISYRLSSMATFPAQIEDAWGAVRWLRENAASIGGNPHSIGAWGHSAGGHLAALLGLTAHEATLGGDKIPLKAVVPLSAPSDLGTMPGANDPQSPEALLVGGTARQAPEEMQRASPLSYARQSTPIQRARFLIVHGKRDETVPFEQGLTLHKAIPDSSFLAIGTGGHDTDSGDVGWPEILAVAMAYFRTHLA